MISEEKQVSREMKFDGKVVKLYLDQVVLDNGMEAFREVIEHPGGVCVLPLDENGDIYMVKQFRYPFMKVLCELPAGKLEYGESHRECGIRELKEETGAVADSVEYLGCIYPTVAYDTEIIHMYLARGLHFGEQQPDEGEFLDVVKIPFEKAVEMALSGELPDAKTQAAILKTKILLDGKKI
ncbi:MAG: NUDIX hydrolase [Ruminococcus sp.]|nr:NUDIX hydrolase [Ruminococcus sp.]